MTIADISAPSRPCKRGHSVPRVINAQGFPVCPECVREDKRSSAARRRAKVKEARRVALKPEPPELAPTPSADADARRSAAPGTFLAVAREYLATKDDIAPKTAAKQAFLMGQLRDLHDRQMSELKTPDYVRAFKAIEAVGDRRETAHRAGGLATQITRFAMNHGYIESNPLPSGQLLGTLKPVKVESHSAITDPRPGDTHDSAPRRFGQLLDAILTYEFTRSSRNHPSVGTALSLAPYLFVRPGELRQGEWREINFERAEWVIPPERMKQRRPFLIPLSRQVLSILRQQHAVSGQGRYVFPAKARTNQRLGEEQPISENAFREALQFVMALMREPKDAQMMHGFRSIASTLLNGQLRFDSSLVELQLAHARSDKVASVYDRDQRVPERVELMQKWSDYVDKLRTEASRAGDIKG